ncbi:hypothetical protein E2C01_083151 [Portunus trituberculatus]|uniref:Uncharacterized protein n=1 Tax=Portunus trituberculatus TaxID=210409 RepID=A0A5B7IRQ2_PORTR|nr:hypothetical protein [Portunus trituberculatus]
MDTFCRQRRKKNHETFSLTSFFNSGYKEFVHVAFKSPEEVFVGKRGQRTAMPSQHLKKVQQNATVGRKGEHAKEKFPGLCVAADGSSSSPSAPSPSFVLITIIIIW